MRRISPRADSAMPQDRFQSPANNAGQEISKLCLDANSVELRRLVWMHTFSPSRCGAWAELSKPFSIFTRIQYASPGDASTRTHELNHPLPATGSWLHPPTLARRSSSPLVDPEVGRVGRLDARRQRHDWRGRNSPFRRQRVRSPSPGAQGCDGDEVRVRDQRLPAWASRGRGERGPWAKVKALVSDYEQRYAVAPELQDAGARHRSLLYGRAAQLGILFLSSAASRASRPRSVCMDCGSSWPRAPPRADGGGYGFAGGRLEDRRAARDEVMGDRLPGGTSLGPHLSSCARRTSGAGLAHARDLPDDRGGQARGGTIHFPSAKASPPGVRRGGGPGAQRSSLTSAPGSACWRTR